MSEAKREACSLDGCQKPRAVKGMCRLHYQRAWRTGSPILPSIEDRIWAGVDRSDVDACWLFGGSLDQSGYGQISYLGNKNWRAHRLVYTLAVGQIPEGYQVDHVCHNASDCAGGTSCQHRRCVNPKHLEAVTLQENTMRSPLSTASRNAAKTHCPQGHPYSPENTRILIRRKSGRQARECRACGRARRAAYEERRRQARRSAA